MATGPASLVICCIALCILCMTILTCGQCVARFNFHGINHTTTINTSISSLAATTTTTTDITLAMQRGSALNINFNVVIEGCSSDNENHRFTITVSRQEQTKGETHYRDFCKLVPDDNGMYHRFRPTECGCVDCDKGIFFLRRRALDEDDETTWGFNAISLNLEAKALINLVLEYPPRVTALTFMTRETTSGEWNDVRSKPLAPGAELAVDCHYDAGKPPVSTAALRIVHNNTELRGDKQKGTKNGKSRRVRYLVKGGVTCSDAGAVSCLVKGASRNVSSTLLVKCPPRITDKRHRWFVGNLLHPLDLLFPVYSYTTSFRTCTLSSKGLQSQNCSQPDRNFSMIGTPPELTLKIVFGKLTPDDDGEKELTISNDAGSDQVTFGVQISDLVLTTVHRYQTESPRHEVTQVSRSRGKTDVSPKSITPGPDTEDGADAHGETNADAGDGDAETNAAMIAGIVIGATAVLILISVIISVVLVRRRRCSNVPRRITFRPRGNNRSVPSSHLYDGLQSAFFPRSIKDVDDDETDTMHANDDYLHPIPSPTLPPTDAAPPLPRKPQDVDETTGNVYQMPLPRKPRRQQSDVLPEPPQP